MADYGHTVQAEGRTVRRAAHLYWLCVGGTRLLDPVWEDEVRELVLAWREGVVEGEEEEWYVKLQQRQHDSSGVS